MKKGATGFKGTTKIPWDKKIAYKFVVDGQWLVNDREPTENDNSGNVNNIYTAPSQPTPLENPVTVPTATVNGFAVEPKLNGHAEVATEVKLTPNGSAVAASDNGKPATMTSEKAVNTESSLPQMLSDLASTIAARHGTNSALQYVATGFGAAVHSVVGVDPINAQKVSYFSAPLNTF